MLENTKLIANKYEVLSQKQLTNYGHTSVMAVENATESLL
jgi:hypothetical protein